MALPDPITIDIDFEEHSGQKGRGGKYVRLQLLHFWRRSSSRLVPSQKCSVSGVMIGKNFSDVTFISSKSQDG